MTAAILYILCGRDETSKNKFQTLVDVIWRALSATPLSKNPTPYLLHSSLAALRFSQNLRCALAPKSYT